MSDEQKSTREQIKYILGWSVVLIGVFIAAYFISKAKPRSRLVCDSSRSISLTSFGSCRAADD